MNNTNPNSNAENHLHQMEARWFAVCTKYKREKVVHQRLQAKGVESYLPLQRLVRRYVRKVRTVELPLISRYVFTRIVKKQYVPVLETPDVSGFVRFSSNLISIPDREIEMLRCIVGEGMDIEVEPNGLCEGDEVEVISGNLAGLRGILLGRESRHNFLVELSQIGYSLRIQVNPSLLRTVGRRRPETAVKPLEGTKGFGRWALQL